MTLERIEARTTRTLGGWLIAAWVVLLFVSTFKFSGFRDPALAAAGDASIEILIELAAYAMIAILILQDWMATRVEVGSVGVRLLVAFGILSVVSAAWSRVPMFSLVRGLQIVVIGLLTAYTTAVWARDIRLGRRQWTSIRTSLLLLIVGISVLALLWSVWPAGRFAWPGVHPGVTGEYLAVGGLIGASMLFERRRLSRSLQRLLPALVVGMIAMMVLTATRSVTAAFVCTIPVFLFTSPGGRRTLKGLVSAFLAFLLLAPLILWPSSLFSYALRGGSVGQLITLNGRLELWGYALETLEASPWLGFGYGSGRLVLTEEIAWSGTGHNLWIESAISLGMVGAVMVTLILGWVLMNAVRSHHRRANPTSNVTLSLVTFIAIESIAGATFAQPGFTLTLVALLVAAGSSGLATMPEESDDLRSPEGVT